MALLRGDAVHSRVSAGVRTHSQSVLPMVQELLAAAGITLKECDAVAFGSGPGSFTGVRTACGVAQGLAFGAGLPVVPVVTLDAMALACHQQLGLPAGAEVLAVLDARMGEVYWAQYRLADGAAPATVLPPVLSAPEGVQPQGSPVACGNGLSAYAGAFTAAALSRSHADIMPHAEHIARLAALAFAAGRMVTAAEAQPLYLRNKVAYTQAERRAMASDSGKAPAADA